MMAARDCSLDHRTCVQEGPTGSNANHVCCKNLTLYLGTAWTFFFFITSSDKFESALYTR